MLCPICHDIGSPTDPLCNNCQTHQHILGTSPVPVRILAFFTRAEPLRDALHHYKNINHPQHNAAQRALHAHLENTWPTHHEAIVVVPSTKHAHTTNPLSELVARHHPNLIAPNPLAASAPAPERQRIANPTLFTVTRTVKGQSLTLVEDAYVTGATAQSAAHALTQAGATVTNITAIGRRINPAHTPDHPHHTTT